MTLEQFEADYAARSGVTVEWLHEHGRRAAVCTCGEDDCPGWQMLHVPAEPAVYLPELMPREPDAPRCDGSQRPCGTSWMVSWSPAFGKWLCPACREAETNVLLGPADAGAECYVQAQLEDQRLAAYPLDDEGSTASPAGFARQLGRTIYDEAVAALGGWTPTPAMAEIVAVQWGGGFGFMTEQEAEARRWAEHRDRTDAPGRHCAHLIGGGTGEGRCLSLRPDESPQMISIVRPVDIRLDEPPGPDGQVFMEMDTYWHFRDDGAIGVYEYRPNITTISPPPQRPVTLASIAADVERYQAALRADRAIGREEHHHGNDQDGDAAGPEGQDAHRPGALPRRRRHFLHRGPAAPDREG